MDVRGRAEGQTRIWLAVFLLAAAFLPAAAGGGALAAPPETTITSGPGSTVATGSATFSFTSSQAGSKFACALDTGAFGDCVSPRAGGS